jgi:hypothetical protein
VLFGFSGDLIPIFIYLFILLLSVNTKSQIDGEARKENFKYFFLPQTVTLVLCKKSIGFECQCDFSIDCEKTLFLIERFLFKKLRNHFLVLITKQKEKLVKISRKIKNGCRVTLKILFSCCAVFQSFASSKNTTNVCQWTNSTQQLVFGSFCVGKRRGEEEKTCCC